eukprot:CAMPEP_0119263376 /NCGR_PEP_ID=MMETSP1329-20130426/2788_1 /TAXON_ID=114041 /ORGANISM="Genus nov. species nov., Strain RCC1024" /LENGTH=73 /DNA_ID=CAMNT_0007263077 /DNA_START=237 /DNA_END=458 /DNA_ORIENTATION=+
MALLPNKKSTCREHAEMMVTHFVIRHQERAWPTVNSRVEPVPVVIVSLTAAVEDLCTAPGMDNGSRADWEVIS